MESATFQIKLPRMFHSKRFRWIFTLIFSAGYLFVLTSSCRQYTGCNSPEAELSYTIDLSHPETGYIHVNFLYGPVKQDTINLRMARWAPGYYQLMDYGKKVKDLSVKDMKGKELEVLRSDESTWQVINPGKKIRVSYRVLADRRFVAENFIDSSHAYILPAATLLYPDMANSGPISIKVESGDDWQNLVTGLEKSGPGPYEFSAADLDVLFDSPILAGNLTSLPTFEVNGVKHFFAGYGIAEGDYTQLMNELRQIVQEATGMMGQVPYSDYTFIGTGPGFGGIEHLNSTAVSFTGQGLDNREQRIATLSFLCHEYFHNFNVKRIRPFELGPFDYSRANRTHLLWVSEGLTVYYEYLIMKRAGLISTEEMLSLLSRTLEAAENDPGRKFQTLAEASYSTWDDGPFGRQGEDDRSISVYDKGCGIGLILDLSIRQATGNDRSLDDVLRLLYNRYYKKLKRGFTDAEFRDACEEIAGVSLAKEFNFVYTVTEPDYETYLAHAGLKLIRIKDPANGRLHFSIQEKAVPLAGQTEMLANWLY